MLWFATVAVTVGCRTNEWLHCYTSLLTCQNLKYNFCTKPTLVIKRMTFWPRLQNQSNHSEENKTDIWKCMCRGKLSQWMAASLLAAHELGKCMHGKQSLTFFNFFAMLTTCIMNTALTNVPDSPNQVLNQSLFIPSAHAAASLVSLSSASLHLH